jgi:pilus assembly protein CpaB
MKRAQLIGVAIALAAGGAAAFMMKGVVNKPQKVIVQETVNATEVLVARADIGLGTVANEGQFRWQNWPKDAVSPSFITKAAGAGIMRDLSGSVARAPILAGEPITANKLIKPGQGGVLAAILPAGMRAISTKIKDETAVGKLILPNDHVDVILSRRFRNQKTGAEEHVSDTLFRNVRVLAIGQQIEAKEGKKNAEGSTATLELTDKQAEVLALANSMGEIALALRSVADMVTDGPVQSGDIKRRNSNSSSIRVLRYGQKSRAYGVN